MTKRASWAPRVTRPQVAGRAPHECERTDSGVDAPVIDAGALCHPLPAAECDDVRYDAQAFNCYAGETLPVDAAQCIAGPSGGPNIVYCCK